ncbi:hypothetical protein SLEP1_g17438 [Rubroshorea leprosula]|uniref:F-box domain-containing protein n=1 Tax=Rubroshorea leprosula TaxID=152421 RepID=A0AAV5IUD8_9ROSI|nr:hypothetical protein SLEP1_g17438 [Rubroshorea leprosula]
MDPKGTIVFSTINRPNYVFDVFSIQLNHITAATKDRLTDGQEQPDRQFQSWAALHLIEIGDKDKKITRLTPYGAVDYSLAVSKSGKFLAITSEDDESNAESDLSDDPLAEVDSDNGGFIAVATSFTLSILDALVALLLPRVQGEEIGFVNLDENLLFEVLKHVDARTLGMAACVSKLWHKTVQDERLIFH